MRGTPSSARSAALIAGGALVVHELRYLLAPAGDAGHGGHAYLPLLHLLIALALAGACVQLAVLVRRARATGPVERGRRARAQRGCRARAQRGCRARAQRGGAPGFRLAWALAAAAILAVFTGQELIEGALSAGRSPGLAAVFAGGGWIAPLLAIAAGALVAAGLRGADAAIAAARRAGARESSIRPPAAHPAAPAAPRRRAAALAEHLAGRAPPRTA